MTYNEFVKQPSVLKRRMEHKIEDVQLKWTICQSTSAGGDRERIQTSVSNRTERSLIRYIDAKRELEELAEALEDSRNEVRDFFYNNLAEQDADILEWRYIAGRDLQEIAEIVGVEYQTIKNRMSNANKTARMKYQLLVENNA